MADGRAPNDLGTYKGGRRDAFLMRREGRLAVLIGSIAVIAAVLAVGVFVLTRPPSRAISIEELRAGIDFVLGAVRFQQTGFVDNQNGPVVDGGYVVSFRVGFAAGVSEDVSFAFDGYCAVGSVSEVSTDHRGPAAVFRHECGQGNIRVTVA